jgi:putative nucleotidyltransferase with HDIG domain
MTVEGHGDPDVRLQTPQVVDLAEDLVRYVLHEYPERIEHTEGVAERATLLTAAVPDAEAPLLAAAAWLHDIGYAATVHRTGFHPLDGALVLREMGWPLQVAALVAHHSGARYVAAVRHLQDPCRRSRSSTTRCLTRWRWLTRPPARTVSRCRSALGWTTCSRGTGTTSRTPAPTRSAGRTCWRLLPGWPQAWNARGSLPNGRASTPVRARRALHLPFSRQRDAQFVCGLWCTSLRARPSSSEARTSCLEVEVRDAGVKVLHEELARVVLVGRSLDAVLGEITSIARRAIPGSEATSITLIRNDKPFTAAHNGQMALDADELQYQRDYGPCVDAARSGEKFVVGDMATEQRWSDYGPHAPRKVSAARCRCRCRSKRRRSAR